MQRLRFIRALHPGCRKVPGRGMAEIERARKPSSSAPATLGRSNTSPNPAIGAPTLGVSAPGPVAVADALHLLSQPNWSPINFTRPVARGSAINSNRFIAEATSDEQGASYREGFVRIPFAPRKFACFVESRDVTPCGRLEADNALNKVSAAAAMGSVRVGFMVVGLLIYEGPKSICSAGTWI